jgi:hypothetical protein
MVPVCQPGYLGRKRGEVVRTRTTIAQSHTHQWLGTFGGAGNGDYRGELSRATEVIGTYLKAQGLRVAQGVVRLDGLYGNGALVEDIARSGLNYLMRGKDYHLLDLPVVKERLARRSGQARLRWAASLAKRSSLNRTAHSAVQPTSPSIRRNGDRNATAVCACCMPPVSPTVALVTSAPSVKGMAWTPTTPAASVPSSGRALLNRHCRLNRRPPRLGYPSFGAIGLVPACAGTG